MSSPLSDAERAELDRRIETFTLDNYHCLPHIKFNAEQNARFNARFAALLAIREEAYARRLAAMTDEAFAEHRCESLASEAYSAEQKRREQKRAAAEAQRLLDERVLSREEKARCTALGLDAELMPLNKAARQDIFDGMAEAISAEAPAWVRVLEVQPNYLKYLDRKTRRRALRRLVNKAEFMMYLELKE